jgi:hypothetical protein
MPHTDVLPPQPRKERDGENQDDGTAEQDRVGGDRQGRVPPQQAHREHGVGPEPHSSQEHQQIPGEPTSGLEPLTCSLRVSGQWLLGVAGACKYRIDRSISFLCLALCCTVLRSRWCQSGVRSSGADATGTLPHHVVIDKGKGVVGATMEPLPQLNHPVGAQQKLSG